MRSSAGALVPQGRRGRCHLTGKSGRVLGTGPREAHGEGGHKERSARELHFLPFSLIWMAAEKSFLCSWVSNGCVVSGSEDVLVLSRCGRCVQMWGVGILQPTSKWFSKNHYKYAHVPWGCGVERVCTARRVSAGREAHVVQCVCVCAVWVWGVGGLGGPPP